MVTRIVDLCTTLASLVSEPGNASGAAGSFSGIAKGFALLLCHNGRVIWELSSKILDEVHLPPAEFMMFDRQIVAIRDSTGAFGERRGRMK